MNIYIQTQTYRRTYMKLDIDINMYLQKIDVKKYGHTDTHIHITAYE